LIVKLTIEPEPSLFQWDNQFLFFGKNQKLLDVVVDCPNSISSPIVEDDVIFNVKPHGIETNVEIHIFSLLGRHIKSGRGDLFLKPGQTYFVVVNGMTRKVLIN
jgi:hypothetical protein